MWHSSVLLSAILVFFFLFVSRKYSGILRDQDKERKKDIKVTQRQPPAGCWNLPQDSANSVIVKKYIGGVIYGAYKDPSPECTLRDGFWHKPEICNRVVGKFLI